MKNNRSARSYEDDPYDNEPDDSGYYSEPGDNPYNPPVPPFLPKPPPPPDPPDPPPPPPGSTGGQS